MSVLMPEPSAFMTAMPSVLVNTIRLPSGDHAGLLPLPSRISPEPSALTT
jgi:hypothetical protein